MILLRGGRVFTPRGVVDADVRVEGDVITAVASGLDPAGAEVVDVSGCWVGPGLVDPHVHLREPGQEWKEDIASGSAAAAAGGFTAVVAMPNTDPPIDAGHLARFVADRGRQAGLVEVMPAGCVTRGGAELAHLDELWAAGVRIFTDDGDAVIDAGLLRQAMEYLADRADGSARAVIAQHAEDPGLARDGHMHEGTVSSRLGMTGLPAVAEEVVVARDLSLVRLTGCPYHVQHVSTAGTVELVRRAKAEGLPVTAEVTPHHLTLTDTAVGEGWGAVGVMDPDLKMYPPLRSAGDVTALRAALADGTIDCVATDHAPHAAWEQEVPFEEAPRGVIGLETAVPAVLEATGLGPAELFERMSVAPARVAGLARQGRPLAEAGPANLAVIDPNATWVADRFRSRSANSPWRGRELRGRVVATMLEGRWTHVMEGAEL